MFTLTEIENFRETQERSLLDTCRIDSYSFVENSYGEQIQAVISGAVDIACGVYLTGGRENFKGTVIETDTDAVIRLPYDTEISYLDRIRVTERFGVAVSGMVFEVKQEPRKGISGIQVDCSRVDL